ncbi:YadA-like family protein [Enterobacter bugandensis]|uniref:YadA-like family protein n=1 Tax=Enterobacter bugandensis TaxID=881260 RepID=UPI00200347C0|nr:YadA C-terminal domain-containing protein [Enterobacter bugandensis]MCK7435931.1 YadA-like family protein [Enterobacter bugandensis]
MSTFKKATLSIVVATAIASFATNALALPTYVDGSLTNPQAEGWAKEVDSTIADHETKIANLDNENLQTNNHLQSVDADTQALKIQQSKDAQRMDAQDQTISGVSSVAATANDRSLVNEQSITANTQAISDNTANITTNTGNIATNTQAITDAQTAHNQLVQRVALDEQYDGVAISKNRDDIAVNTQGITANTNAIATNSADIAATKTDVTANTGAIATTKAAVAATQSDVAANSQQIAINTQGITQAQNTGAYAQSRADAAYANTEANHKALVSTNAKVAANSAELANHEARIQTLEANNNVNFGSLKNEVEENRKRASAGIAGVAAMANIPQVINGQTFSVGAGAGNTDGESAVAVGFSARATENVIVKASVSNDTQHNFVVGGGVSYGW